MEPILVLPSVRYKESYVAALREFQKEGRRLEINVDEVEKFFQKHLDEFQDEADGKNLKVGRVPSTRYWLVENDTYLGGARIAHSLNEKLFKIGGHIGYEVSPLKRKNGYGTLILKLALPKVKELGITRALLTCDSTNIASRKIIENAGGVLENEVPGEKNGDVTKLRFWIKL
jgi:predicted acetyltransferase